MALILFPTHDCSTWRNHLSSGWQSFVRLIICFENSEQSLNKSVFIYVGLFWLSGLHPMWHTVIPATEIWVCHTLLQRLSSHCESLRYQTSARRGSNIGASRINTDKTASMFRNTVLCKLNVNSSNYCWTVSQRSVTVLYAGEVEWIPTCLSANIKAVKRISQHCWLFAYRNNLLLHLFQ